MLGCTKLTSGALMSSFQRKRMPMDILKALMLCFCEDLTGNIQLSNLTKALITYLFSFIHGL